MAVIRPSFNINDMETGEQFAHTMRSLDLNIPIAPDSCMLKKEAEVYGRKLQNSIVIQPMEGLDASADGSPGPLTFARYSNFARQGAGTIWFEATAVTSDGRDSLHQLWLNAGNADSFKGLVNYVNEISMESHGFVPYKILQITHSGRCSVDAIGRPRPLAVSDNPYLDLALGKAEIVSDEYLENLRDSMIGAAKLAKYAGFDAVDVKLCHQYLLKETLCAYKRAGKYGGSAENRFRLAMEIIDGIRQELGHSLDIAVRLSAYDSLPYPYGWGMVQNPGVMKDDTAEVDLLLDELGKKDVELVNITTFEPRVAPEGLGYMADFLDDAEIDPYRGAAHLLQATRRLRENHPKIKFVCTGLAWFAQFAPLVGSGGIRDGWFDLAGFGRNVLADHGFVPRVLGGGSPDSNSLCLRCDRCYDMFLRDIPTGCPVHDPFYKLIDRMDRSSGEHCPEHDTQGSVL